MPEAKRLEGDKLLKVIRTNEDMATIINHYRGIVNFAYWRARCESEQTRDALEARKQIYEGRQEYKVNAALEAARDQYEAGLEHWRLVMSRFELLRKDALTGRALLEVANQYREVLKSLDEPFPPLGYGLISLDEVKDLQGFAKQLSADDRSPALDHVWSLLGSDAAGAGQELMRDLASGRRDPEPLAVMFYINQLLKRQDFYKEELFADVELSDEVRETLERPRDELTNTELRLLNRQLWQALFSDQFNPPREEFVLQLIINEHPGAAEELGLKEPTTVADSVDIKPPADEQE